VTPGGRTTRKLPDATAARTVAPLGLVSATVVLRSTAPPVAFERRPVRATEPWSIDTLGDVAPSAAMVRLVRFVYVVPLTVTLA
jgi:hypothetical protein